EAPVTTMILCIPISDQDYSPNGRRSRGPRWPPPSGALDLPAGPAFMAGLAVVQSYPTSRRPGLFEVHADFKKCTIRAPLHAPFRLSWASDACFLRRGAR